MSFLLEFSRGIRRMNVRCLEGTPRAVLLRAGLLIAIIALIDWRIDLNISFGFLYLFPMLLVGTVLNRWQIAATALLCTLLSDVFDPFPFSLLVGLPQDILVFTSLAGAGLIAYEVTRSRRKEMENLRRVESEAAARRAAEEQLEFLIDSSPAAILTAAANGSILLANGAAHRLLGVPAGGLPGRNIGRYISALGCVPSLDDTSQTFRTEMQCRGVRESGEVFLANVFFSTYETAMGPRLAALVVDASEELREREESSLEQMLAGSRILVGAVSHEIRNVCGAISVIYENLARGGGLSTNRDFEALGALVETLNRIACLDLKQSHQPQIGSVELPEVFDDLRIVLDAHCQDSGITVEWQIPEDLPPVWADRHSLFQALLNLTRNSEQALENAEVKRISISAASRQGSVLVRVSDSGPGIASTEKLFQPFQKGAESTGLGLFLSRALLRSCGGELRYHAIPGGSCFAVSVNPVSSGDRIPS